MKTTSAFRSISGMLALWLASAAAVLAQAVASPPPADRAFDESGWAARLGRQGFAEEQILGITACLAEAQRQRLPATALTLRLEEGLAKNVEPERLLAGLQTRLRRLLEARTMAEAARYDLAPEGPGDELLVAVGLALESGLPADDLAAVLRRGNGQSTLRVASIVEAGESLHLAGLDPETTRGLMNDCLDRNLRRMEVLRATRYTIQQHRGGMDGERIRQSLWSGQAAVEGPQGWRGGGGGGPPAGAGPGGMGPGSGGPGRPPTPGSGNGGGGGPGNGAGGPP